jgi:hypothetical protein
MREDLFDETVWFPPDHLPDLSGEMIIAVDVETKDPDRIVDHVYYLDFLSDVIGDLQQEYDSVYAAAAEDFERSRKKKLDGQAGGKNGNTSEL